MNMKSALWINPIVFILALSIAACSARKSDDDAAPPNKNKKKNNPSGESEGQNPTSDEGPESPGGSEESSEGLSILSLQSSTIINGVQRGYLLLGVQHSPSPVTDITAIKLVNEQGTAKDITSACMSAKTYYGPLTKEALAKSGYFKANDPEAAEAIDEIVKRYGKAKLLVISPIPSVIKDVEEPMTMTIQAKTADGQVVEK